MNDYSNNELTFICYFFLAIIFASTSDQTWHLLVRSCAGILSGATVAIITNPLDVIRVNIQVSIFQSKALTMFQFDGF